MTRNSMTPADAQNNQIDFRFAPHLSWTCIGLPDDECKSLIREDGSLLYGWNRVISFRLRHTLCVPKAIQKTESAKSAVVVTRLNYGFATLTLTAFAHLEGDRRTDVVLWKLKASPRMSELLLGAVTITIDEVDRAANQKLLSSPANDLPPPAASPAASPDAPVILRSVPSRLSFCADYEHMGRNVFTTESEPVEPGGVLTGAFVLPLNHDQVDAMDFAWCGRALTTMRRFWESYPAQKLALQVPDKQVQDMIAACARNILQARVIKDGVPFFQVGPLVYRGLWIVDGYFITEAARYLGHDREADLAWDALLGFRKEDGSIEIIPDHSKETGVALATLVRMTELSGNWERLREQWPIVQAAVRRIGQMIEEAASLPGNHPCHGLLPESFGDGGIGGKRPEYTTTLWVLAGLKQTTEAARKLGNEDAATFDQMYQSLLKNFRAHAERHRVLTPDGIRHLPMAMQTGQHNFGLTHVQGNGAQRPWSLIGPGVATWALCQAIYPGEVLAPEDSLVQDLLALSDSLDNEEGLPRETGWLPWRAVWSYHASFAAHVALYADRTDKAVEYLYAMANHASPTRVWREEQSLKSHPQARYIGDMPHNWASAEFVRLVRNLLVFEMGDELHLLKGMPSAWMQPSNPVIVESTPTRFGRVSLRLDVDSDGGAAIVIGRDLTWPHQPVQVKLRLPISTANVQIEFKGRTEAAVVSPEGWVDLPEAAQVRVALS